MCLLKEKYTSFRLKCVKTCQGKGKQTPPETLRSMCNNGLICCYYLDLLDTKRNNTFPKPAK